MAYGAVYKAQQKRIAALERDLEIARRPLGTLRDIASEKQRLRKSTVWAWREVEQLLMNAPVDVQATDNHS